MLVHNDRYIKILHFEVIFCKALSYFQQRGLQPCFAYGFFLTESKTLQKRPPHVDVSFILSDHSYLTEQEKHT